ncbi:hypothetical protein [Actinoplanes aureus]|uniref:Diphthamide synthase domain-containing protein n=1 Tax=Actinoplanes aureus TaxID=2792083 RepID=A0A931CKZ6_9ACTN|nr:hypothetical protein [Actinoplanes aureus]MBG0569318.1 hypothetical protein [Actinoplanes aureus]
MRSHNSTTCYAWSGGKDSFLAFCLEQQVHAAPRDQVLFVTFVPQEGLFRCHPLGLLETQGSILGVQHLFIAIDSHRWADDYRRAFAYLRDAYGVKTVVTGDIFATESDMNEYWLARMLSTLSIQLRAPLLGLYWAEIISLLSTFRITAVVSGMAAPFYQRGVLGRKLTLDFLNGSFRYNESRIEFDMCGEQGEYHTTVTAMGDETFCLQDLGNFAHQFIDSVWSLDLAPNLQTFEAKRIRLG